jgi:uncharacterized protein YaiL (DUF2058 family)
MSGSLRDQLLEAGFNAPKPKPKPQTKKKPPRSTHKKNIAKKPMQAALKNQAPDEDALKVQLERKRIKAEIKVLIEADLVKDIVGELPYSYIIGTRVKQLFINEKCHKAISEGELAITRLNGNTHLIPLETAKKVKAINSEWAIITASSSDEQQLAINGEYTDYKIPDDLKW